MIQKGLSTGQQLMEESGVQRPNPHLRQLPTSLESSPGSNFTQNSLLQQTKSQKALTSVINGNDTPPAELAGRERVSFI